MAHQEAVAERLAPPLPSAADASPKVRIASKLKTVIGAAIYRARKCTVEPVIGIIKGAGLSPVLAARRTGDRKRVVPGLFGLQSAPVPYPAPKLRASALSGTG